jgi:hypothetical protein
MQTIRYRVFLPLSTPSFYSRIFRGNDRSEKKDRGQRYGSGLSQTDFACIIVEFSGGMNERRRKKFE